VPLIYLWRRGGRETRLPANARAAEARLPNMRDA
jgi:hypothetical protein